jgi:hypothetical protein
MKHSYFLAAIDKVGCLFPNQAHLKTLAMMTQAIAMPAGRKIHIDFIAQPHGQG